MNTGAMSPQESIEMMRRASGEIKQLRAINAELAPKADAYDRLAQVLDMMPRRSQGMGEDIAWLLDKRIDSVTEYLKSTELKAKEPDEPAPEPQP